MNFKPLTREEVARAYAFARQEAQPGSLLMYLLADLDRLRALVKAGEREGRSESSAQLEEDAFCPWCRYLRGDKSGDFKKMHADDCSAFTPEGFVK